MTSLATNCKSAPSNFYGILAVFFYDCISAKLQIDAIFITYWEYTVISLILLLKRALQCVDSFVEGHEGLLAVSTLSQSVRRNVCRKEYVRRTGNDGRTLRFYCKQKKYSSQNFLQRMFCHHITETTNTPGADYHYLAVDHTVIWWIG